jgi:ArsR family transcriptional regulator
MEINQVQFAKAIADETRQEILRHLCCVWLNVSDIVEKLSGKVNQPTISHHLKILEEANLVQVRIEGRYHYYTLNQAHLTVCCGSLIETYAPDYSDAMLNVEVD